jgi:hypothetical protein
MTTTHITLLCDRSGSMDQIRADAEGAVNAFLDGQRVLPGDCTITLADFDAPGGPRNFKDIGLKAEWLHTLYQGPIANCPAYTLTPRGNTALLDAIGMTITATGEYLSSFEPPQRPDVVIFVVQTDGEENSSRDWTLERVQELIKQQTDVYSWEFIFLGMGPDTFEQGRSMGFAQNTRSAQAGAAYVGTYAMTSSHVADRRAGGQGLNLDVDVDDEGNVSER